MIFFFFQAEDGIRDDLVTGVQTCALPISTTWTLFDAVDFTHPERVEALIARGSGTAWNTVYRKDGVTRVANVRCYSVDYEGASYAYLVLDDVTEQNYLKAAFDAVPDPLLILSTQQ